MDGLATVQRNGLIARSIVIFESCPGEDPSLIWRDSKQDKDRLSQRLSQSTSIGVNAIHKSRGSLGPTKEDIATGAKQTLTAFDVRNLVGRRTAVQRRQPQPRFALRVQNLHDDLFPIGRDVVAENLEPGYQNFRPSGFQVGHP